MPTLLCDSEAFDIGSITMFMHNYQGKFNSILFINLNEHFEAKQFEQLWDLFRESNQVIPVVLTNVVGLEAQLIKDDAKANKKLFKRLRKKNDPVSIIDQLNLRVKEIVDDLT